MLEATPPPEKARGVDRKEYRDNLVEKFVQESDLSPEKIRQIEVFQFAPVGMFEDPESVRHKSKAE